MNRVKIYYLIYGCTITSGGGWLTLYRDGSDYVASFVDIDSHSERPTFYLNSDVSYISDTGYSIWPNNY